MHEAAVVCHPGWDGPHISGEEGSDAARRELPPFGEHRLEEREGAALPKRVAPVDELVSAPLEAAVGGHLSVDEPVS